MRGDIAAVICKQMNRLYMQPVMVHTSRGDYSQKIQLTTESADAYLMKGKSRDIRAIKALDNYPTKPSHLHR